MLCTSLDEWWSMMQWCKVFIAWQNQPRLSLANRSSSTLSLFLGSGFMKNGLVSIGSPAGGVDQRWTNLTSPCSSHLITMVSLSHTPVVHTDKGPRGCNAPVALPMGPFAVVKVSSFSFCGRLCRRIRLARTTSVKIRSPTMISSRSLIGEWREEKYERMAVIHEYAGLNDLWNRTGARRWWVTDSDYKKNPAPSEGNLIDKGSFDSPVYLLHPILYQQNYWQWGHFPHQMSLDIAAMLPIRHRVKFKV